MISPTFPRSDCGISTYTGYLVTELAALDDVEIVGVEGKRPLLWRSIEAALRSDVVHIQHAISNFGYLGLQSWLLYAWLRRLKKPVLTTLHEQPQFAIRSPKDRIARQYIQFFLRFLGTHSDLLWVHSDHSVTQLQQMGVRAPIEVIAHGTLPVCRVPAIPHERPTLGFFGFIAEHKGIHHILEALPRLPALTLQIAGTPRDTAGDIYLQRLQRLVDHLGLAGRVTFLGFLPDAQLAEFFASVDVVLFPYDYVTASGALHLALAHQCLILASDAPLFLEAKRRYGCLETFDVASTDSLVQALNYLLHDETAQTALRAGCERFAQESSWHRIAEHTWNTYRLLLHGGAERVLA